MQVHRIALAAVCAASLAAPVVAADVASAKIHNPTHCRAGYKRQPVKIRKRVHRHGRWVVVKRHGKPVMLKKRVRQHGHLVVVHRCVPKKHHTRRSAAPVQHVAAAPAPRSVPAVRPAPAGPPPTFGVGGNLAVLGNCSGSLGASVVRIILFYNEPLDRFLSCARNEVAHGRRLILTVQYANRWSIAQDQAWFRAAMAVYAPLHPIEVSVGNEQAAFADAPVKATPQMYASVWRAVEPIIAGMAPYALRGAGEISPWDLGWLMHAAALGLPGVQVFSGHAYPANGGFAPAALLSVARHFQVTAWATEGICGAGSWPQLGCRPISQFGGYALATEWFTNGRN